MHLTVVASCNCYNFCEGRRHFYSNENDVERAEKGAGGALSYSFMLYSDEGSSPVSSRSLLSSSEIHRRRPLLVLGICRPRRHGAGPGQQLPLVPSAGSADAAHLGQIVQDPVEESSP